VARVLLGVTGGIAAYKACELLRLLVKDGHDVTPLLTPDAERFVTAHTFEALARKEAPRDLYPHLADADLLVIAPLSANTLAKLAHGLADTVLTQAALAVRGPVLVAPAMNVRMWEHAATQANLGTLVDRGVHVIGPEEGELAEGEHGPGRMSEPEVIFARCLELLGADGPLRGKHVLVSAGGTREPLDSVRYLGNRSSGKMGVALAREARRRGADVTLVAYGAMVHTCLEAAELLDASAEVVDIRTLKPLDEETLLGSVAKTGRAVVVQEAPRVAGFGAELVAVIAEKAILDLQGPIVRVTGYDVPFPYWSLEHEYVPTSERVAAAARKVLDY